MSFKKRCLIIIFVCSSILIFTKILHATTGDGNRALKVEFNGLFRSDTDMKKWFRDISSWGVERWVHFIPNQKRFFYREDNGSGAIKTVPFFDRLANITKLLNHLILIYSSVFYYKHLWGIIK